MNLARSQEETPTRYPVRSMQRQKPSETKTKDQLGQHSRRFQVWLKHSITQFTQPPTTFTDSDYENPIQQIKDLRSPPSTLSLDNKKSTTQTIGGQTTPVDSVSRYSVSNIDHALSAFSFTAQRRTELEQTSSSYLPTKDWDWILDGHPEWIDQAETSRQLMLEIYGDFNKDPWNFEEWKLKCGSIGNQEYQFANFHDQGGSEFGNNNETNLDEEDEFGDFQAAQELTDNPPPQQDVPEDDSEREHIVAAIEIKHSSNDNSAASMATTVPEVPALTSSSKVSSSSPVIGFITTDSIDEEDDMDLHNLHVKVGSGQPNHTVLMRADKRIGNLIQPFRNKKSDDPCSSPPSDESQTDIKQTNTGSGTLTMTPTVNNRTSQTYQSSPVIGNGIGGTYGDSSVTITSPDVMVPRTLDYGDNYGGQEYRVHPQDQIEVPSGFPISSTVPADSDDEEEDESSFEATTSSMTSSTVPSVVRFTSEIQQKSTTIGGSNNLVLRIPAAVRLTTPSRQIIRHRDLPRASEYTNNLIGGSIDRNSRSSLYVASPVTICDDDQPSISSQDQLMATPESRFRRRHSHPEMDMNQHPCNVDDELNDGDDDILNKEDDESVIRRLPKSYHYDPNYDDTAEVLLFTIDWERIPYWKLPRLLSPLPLGSDVAQHNIEQVQDQITGRLSELDTLRLEVTRRLMYNIQPHQELLEQANVAAHELAKHLSLSHIYSQRCLDSLWRAGEGGSTDCSEDSLKQGENHHDGGGLLGGAALLDAWDQKKDYQQLRHLLESVATALQLEGTLTRRVATYDIRDRVYRRDKHQQQQNGAVQSSSALVECATILERAQDLRVQIQPSIGLESAHDGGKSVLFQLDCLETLRTRVNRLPMDLMNRLHWWLAAVSIQSCGCASSSFSSTFAADANRRDYDTLVQALLCVNSDQGLQPSTDAGSIDLPTSWPASIQSAFMFEASRALCLALLEPTGRGDEEEDIVDTTDRTKKHLQDEDDGPEWMLLLEEFNRQLLTYDNVFEDGEKLRTMTYSLVSIRFDWEMSSSKARRQGQHYCHLAPIYHRLCFLLTNILHGYTSIVSWQKRVVASAECSGNHRSNSILLKQVLDELNRRRISVWNRCVEVLEQCLEECLQFVSKKKPLFEMKVQRQQSKGHESCSAVDDAVQDDSYWWEDLEGLQDVVRLSDQFLSLRNEFLSASAVKSSLSPKEEVRGSLIAKDGAQLHQNLHSLLRKHLRTVHVEAMNGLGAMLSKEDWSLVPISVTTKRNGRKERPMAAANQLAQGHKSGAAMINRLLQDLLKLQMDEDRYQATHRRSWMNQFCLSKSDGEHLSNFLKVGNPFQVSKGGSHLAPVEALMVSAVDFQDVDTAPVDEVLDMLQSYCGSNNPEISSMVPNSVRNGVFKWVARLLIVTKRLGVDAHKAFSNIFDLYATTAFRICVGNSASERIVVGIDSPSKPPQVSLLEDASAVRAQVSSSPLFGFRRRSGRSTPVKSLITRSSQTVSPHIEAEVCAPLLCEWNGLSPFREFLERAHQNLHGIVKLDLVDRWVPDPAVSTSKTRRSFAEEAALVLEKRQGASWSCLFLAVGLHLATSVATSSLQACEIDNGSPTQVPSLDSIDSYNLSFSRAVLASVPVSNRIACVRAIQAKQIVQENGEQTLTSASPFPLGARKIVAVGGGWEETKLHEHPNSYVESLCDLCSMIWCSLSTKNRLPSGAMKLLWEDLVSGGYVAMLDGFSRVPFCSTEGRALMSMDLAAFSNGITPRSVLHRMEERSPSCLPPPHTNRGEASSLRGMGYVDTYIKVFYYPKMDAMNWIRDNYRFYHFNYCIALVASTSSSDDDGGRSALELLNQVQTLYVEDSSKQSCGTS